MKTLPVYTRTAMLRKTVASYEKVDCHSDDTWARSGAHASGPNWSCTRYGIPRLHLPEYVR
jgi:hypothetical protein